MVSGTGMLAADTLAPLGCGVERMCIRLGSANPKDASFHLDLETYVAGYKLKQ